MNIRSASFLTLSSLALFTSLAHASGTWSAGAGVLVVPDPYRGDNKQVFPLPVIRYDSDKLFFNTLSAGYKLINNENNKLNIIGFYNPLHLNPEDTDDHQMEQLDKRHGTLMGGLAYSHIEDWGTIRTSVVGDLLGESDGIIADIGYLHPFRAGTWSLTPAAGVTWNSANQNQYYYGVSKSESRRSGLDCYDPGSSLNEYIELTANYSINPNWNAYFGGRYIHLNSEIKDSPIVDKSFTGYLTTGVVYTFR